MGKIDIDGKRYQAQLQKVGIGGKELMCENRDNAMSAMSSTEDTLLEELRRLEGGEEIGGAELPASVDDSTGGVRRKATHYTNLDHLTPDDALIVAAVASTGGNIRRAFDLFPLPITRAAFYMRPKAWRERILSLADTFTEATAKGVLRVLESGGIEAAALKLSGMRSPRWRERQECASEVLDRILGRPAQAVEVRGPGERLAALFAAFRARLPTVEGTEDLVIEGQAQELDQTDP